MYENSVYENSEHLLRYLESCPKTWAPYIRIQVRSIQAHIQALRAWADLKPGHIADLFNERASNLETRVTQLLDSLPSSRSPS